MSALNNKTNDLRSWTAALPLYGKLTYVGDQEKPVPSVFFRSAPDDLPYKSYQVHQTARVRYSNDTTGNASHFLITRQEQTSLLISLASVEDVQTPKAPKWSLVLIQVLPSGPKAVEWLLDAQKATQVVDAIKAALAPENEIGKRILDQIPLP